MEKYLDESGRVIDDPAFTPPPGAILYRTRRGTFVFPVPDNILTCTAEHPDDPADPPANARHPQENNIPGNSLEKGI